MEREPEQLEFEFMSELDDEHLEAQKQLLEDDGEDYDQMASSSGC